jgi:hypothetical protein
MKCANCDKDAHYVYRITMDHTVAYCLKDLPSFLHPRLKAKLLETTDEYKSTVAEGVANLTKPVEKEPVVETPEPTVEPTPIKKTAKKSSPKNASDS